ncbi:hypothetical protein CDAR_620961 [Caerostris darwini]|uniref:Uncharacterized protein n=1 Tax=Caerostris darwini TaxID=1538125 RepID=A0AAV4RXL8_9ARAC|nr:hypothetical protein CDAR_620961 [Caerostris darwini]
MTKKRNSVQEDPDLHISSEMSCSGEGHLLLPVYREMVDSTCAYVNATCQSTSVSDKQKKKRAGRMDAEEMQPYARQIAGRLMGPENAKNTLETAEGILIANFSVLQNSLANSARCLGYPQTVSAQRGCFYFALRLAVI